MKAIGVVGSPRISGNTEILTQHALNAIAEEGLDTELVMLAWHAGVMKRFALLMTTCFHSIQE